MAVSGESFLTSAWNGFLLNVKHTLKFAFAGLIAKVFIFIGKVGITAGNIFSLLFIMSNITMDTEEVSSRLGPCLVVGFWTYFTASVFLGLFDTACLAMMTSLSIDMDTSPGNSPTRGPATFHEKCTKITNNTNTYNEERSQSKFRKL